MSLARLAALARRGAAPVGALTEATRPAFDPLVVLDAAAAESAARALPRLNDVQAYGQPRMLASKPPPLAPGLPMPRASALPHQAESEERPTGTAPHHAATPSPPTQWPAGPATRVSPGVPHEADVPTDAVVDAVPAAAMRVLNSPRLPTAAPVSPAILPPARTPKPAPLDAQSIERASEPAPSIAASRHDAEPALHSSAVLVRPMLAPVPRSAVPGDPPLRQTELSIAIGQIDVVMASQRPSPVPAVAPAPDRGFARYAAMRGARDRARW